MAVRTQSYSLRSAVNDLLYSDTRSATDFIKLECGQSMEYQLSAKCCAPNVTLVAQNDLRLGMTFKTMWKEDLAQLEVSDLLTIKASHLYVGAVVFNSIPAKVDLQCTKITVLLYDNPNPHRLELFKKWATGREIVEEKDHSRFSSLLSEEVLKTL